MGVYSYEVLGSINIMAGKHGNELVWWLEQKLRAHISNCKQEGAGRSGNGLWL